MAASLVRAGHDVMLFDGEFDPLKTKSTHTVKYSSVYGNRCTSPLPALGKACHKKQPHEKRSRTFLGKLAIREWSY